MPRPDGHGRQVHRIVSTYAQRHCIASLTPRTLRHAYTVGLRSGLSTGRIVERLDLENGSISRIEVLRGTLSGVSSLPLPTLHQF